ncbi:MAG: hypothetical protein LBK04_01640, partial [Clostridiales Family XIII bacterium]|nr:hypothetical protein [Clostridiales Family XIII bacterium]
IPGAQFAVSGTKASGGTYTDVQTSDKDGHVLFEYIPPGSYTLSESQKVPGYFTNDTEYTFTVDEKGAISGLPAEKIIFYNDPTVLELDKVDSFTGGPLANAEFTVTAADGREVNEAGVRSSLNSLGVSAAAINTLIADMTAKGSTFDTRTFDVGGTKVTVALRGGASVNITTTTGEGSTVTGLGDAPFTLTSATDENGHTVFKYIPEGEYTLTETGNPDTYLLEDIRYDFEVTARGDIVGIEGSLYIENAPTAIEVDKIDSLSMTPLPGVEFALSGTTFAGEPYEDVGFSDADGHVVFRYIPTGDYSLVETDSPEGYFNDGKSYEFRVNGKGEAIGLKKGLVIENVPSVIEFDKVDGLTGLPLPGAEFTVSGTTLSGKPYDVKSVSQEDGHVRFMYIPAGKYTLRETAVPDGYVLSGIGYDFEIDIRGNITGIPEDAGVIKNAPTAVEFDKTDGNTGRPLEGAEFTIAGTTASGEPYEAVGFSDSEGHVRFDYVPRGSFTLVETANPDGYLLEDISYGFIVNPCGEVEGLPEGLVIENNPTVLEFDKADGLTGKPLRGATFMVSGTTQSGRSYEVKAKSNRTGHVRFDYIPEGDYTLSETANPDGYLLKDVSFDFRVNSDGELIGLPQGMAIDNFPTTVELDKTDMLTGQPLPGVEFTVAGTTRAGKPWEMKALSDSAGKVVFRYIPSGRYTLSETANPDGYLLGDISCDFTVNARGAVVGLPEGMFVENLPTIVLMEKIDGYTGDLLPGAEFVITGRRAVDMEGVKTALEDIGIVAENIDALLAGLSGVDGESGEISLAGHGDEGEDENGEEGEDRDSTKVSLFVSEEKDVAISVPEKDAIVIPGLGNPDFSISSVTGESGPTAFTNIPEGYYSIAEKASPDGYVLGDTLYDFEVNGRGEVEGLPEIIVFENMPTTIEIYKKDRFTEQPVEGVEFAITGVEASGEPYEAAELTDSGGHIAFMFIPEGAYTLRETMKVEGYMDEGISYEFAVDADGKVFGFEDIDKGVENTQLIFYNTPTTVSVRKLDFSDGTQVEGAQLELYREGDEYPAAIWTTTGESYEICYLPAGEYTLHEAKAPPGYTKADDVKFTLSDRIERNSETGEPKYIKHVLMYDKKEPPVLSADTADTGSRIWLLLLPMALLGTVLCASALHKQKRAVKIHG